MYTKNIKTRQETRTRQGDGYKPLQNNEIKSTKIIGIVHKTGNVSLPYEKPLIQP